MQSINAFKKITLNKPVKRRRAVKIRVFFAYLRISLVFVRSFVLIPLYLRYINKEMYGYWLATGGIIAWITLFDLGVASLIGQRVAFFWGSKNKEKIGEYYLYGTAISFLIAILIVISTSIFSSYLPHILNFRRDVIQEKIIIKNCFLISAITFAFTIIDNIQRNFATGLQYVVFPGIISIVSNLVAIIIVPIMLLKGYGLYAIAVGGAIGISLQLLLSLIFSGYILISHKIKFGLNRGVLNEYIKIMPVTLFSGLGNAMSGRIEPLLITMFLIPETAVNYSITKKMGDLLQLIIGVIGGAVFPGFAHAYGEYDNKKIQKIFKEILLVFLLMLVFFVTIYVGFNKSFVKLWMGFSNFSGTKITVLMALAFAVITLNNLLSRLLGATGYIARSAFINGVTSIATLLVMLIFLKLFGIFGLPLAIFVSKLTSVVIISLQLVKKLNFRFKDLLISSKLLLLVSLINMTVLFLFIKLTANNWLIFTLQLTSASILVFLSYMIFSKKIQKHIRSLLKFK